MENLISSSFPYFYPPAIPFGSVVAYLLFSKVICRIVCNSLGLELKGPFLKIITIFHSSFLALYSLWTCYNTIPLAVNYYLRNGYDSTFCDVDGTFWNQHNFGFWVTHFYISKFYEFADTWIILLKQQEPMFLQTFHHAGIVLFMWAFVVTQCSGPGLVITCFNSFIHTLMYTYYVAAALGYRSPLKSYLTIAQIVQFIVGIMLTIPLYFKTNCLNKWQIYSVAGIHAYTVVLISLFIQFYMKSYTSTKDDSKMPPPQRQKKEN